MNVLPYILSRLLPKTGQSTVYVAGDDGTFQAGWWDNRLLAANKQRFIDKGDGTIIDRATKLMWQKEPFTTTMLWAGTFYWSALQNTGGYTNWKVPNVFELASIIDYGRNAPSLNPIFTDAPLLRNYWTSTTAIGNTIYAYRVFFTNGQVLTADKAGTFLIMRCCRRI